MLDANSEIERLRHRLKFKNLSDKIIDEICDDVSREISQITSDLMADAMNEAVNAGGDAMSIDFIDELKAVRSGASVDIITESGKTDFSEPPFPMLPRLLKNAKVAKDGSLYKVIPIRQKGNEGQKRNMALTTEAAYRNIEDARRAAKVERDEYDGRNYTSPDAMKGMDTFSAMQAISKSRQKQPTQRNISTEPIINFRTASSKQDASSKWVHPGRPVNMGPALNEINSRLHEAIDRAIEDVIRAHEGMY